MNDNEALAWLNNAMQEAIGEALKPVIGKPGVDADLIKSVIVAAASAAYRASLEELIQVVPSKLDDGSLDIAMPQWLAVQIGLEKGQ